MWHELKIKDCYYEQIVDEIKTFEIRYNDRGFQKDDCIKFFEEDGSFERFGEWKITYVHSGYGLAENFVILGIKRKKAANERT